jgi:hypothetical protein
MQFLLAAPVVAVVVAAEVAGLLEALARLLLPQQHMLPVPAGAAALPAVHSDRQTVQAVVQCACLRGTVAAAAEHWVAGGPVAPWQHLQAGRQAGNITHELLGAGTLDIRRLQFANDGKYYMASASAVLAVLLLVPYLVSELLLAELHLLQVDSRVDLQLQRVKLPLQHQHSAAGIAAFSTAHLASL